MKKTVKILYLPTEEVIKNHIVKHFEEGALLTINDTLIGKVVDSQVQIQDLYATISPEDEPIKEGDWVIRLEDNHIWQVDTNIDVFNKLAKAMGDWFKIIATTDPKLTKFWLEDVYKDGEKIITHKGISKLQQSFLKEYVDNPNGEYEVEYERGNYDDWLDNGGSPPSMKLKLNRDNTVNITAVEEKMYSSQQIKQAFRDGWIDCQDMQGVDFDASLTNWIKKKLINK
jgi:hypothetical protein